MTYENRHVLAIYFSAENYWVYLAISQLIIIGSIAFIGYIAADYYWVGVLLLLAISQLIIIGYIDCDYWLLRSWELLVLLAISQLNIFIGYI